MQRNNNVKLLWTQVYSRPARLFLALLVVNAVGGFAGWIFCQYRPGWCLVITVTMVLYHLWLEWLYERGGVDFQKKLDVPALAIALAFAYTLFYFVAEPPRELLNQWGISALKWLFDKKQFATLTRIERHIPETEFLCPLVAAVITVGLPSTVLGVIEEMVESRPQPSG